MRCLKDADAFEEVVGRRGAELVLHGHNHTRSVAHLKSAAARTPQGRIAVIGVPSASSTARSPRHRAAYHLIRIERGDGLWRVSARSQT